MASSSPSVDNKKPGGGGEPDGDERGIWEKFFSVTIAVGQRLFEEKLVSGQDLETRNAYLQVGLTSITLFDAVKRSLGRNDGIVLGVGHAADALITLNNCPRNQLPLFHGLMALKKVVEAANLSGNDNGIEVAKARVQLLVYDMDAHRLPAVLRSSVDYDNKVYGHDSLLVKSFVGAARQVMQNPVYRANFADNVLAMLDVLCNPKVPKRLDETQMWQCFMDASYEAGLEAITQYGSLTAEECQDSEPFVYDGLTSLTIFNGLLRQPGLSKAIVLGDRQLLTAETCPDSDDNRNMLAVLLQGKAALKELKLDEPTLLQWRNKFMRMGADDDADADGGGGDKKVENEASKKENVVDDEKTRARRKIETGIKAAVRGVAVRLTQKPAYRAAFGNVLQLLGETLSA